MKSSCTALVFIIASLALVTLPGGEARILAQEQDELQGQLAAEPKLPQILAKQRPIAEPPKDSISPTSGSNEDIPEDITKNMAEKLTSVTKARDSATSKEAEEQLADEATEKKEKSPSVSDLESYPNEIEKTLALELLASMESVYKKKAAAELDKAQTKLDKKLATCSTNVKSTEEALAAAEKSFDDKKKEKSDLQAILDDLDVSINEKQAELNHLQDETGRIQVWANNTCMSPGDKLPEGTFDSSGQVARRDEEVTSSDPTSSDATSSDATHPSVEAIKQGCQSGQNYDHCIAAIRKAIVAVVEQGTFIETTRYQQYSKKLLELKECGTDKTNVSGSVRDRERDLKAIEGEISNMQKQKAAKDTNLKDLKEKIGEQIAEKERVMEHFYKKRRKCNVGVRYIRCSSIHKEDTFSKSDPYLSEIFLVHGEDGEETKEVWFQSTDKLDDRSDVTWCFVDDCTGNRATIAPDKPGAGNAISLRPLTPKDKTLSFKLKDYDYTKYNPNDSIYTYNRGSLYEDCSRPKFDSRQNPTNELFIGQRANDDSECYMDCRIDDSKMIKPSTQ
eukprot:Nk52_evm18s255 gene=Nk52_evmTU18s255